MTSTTVSQRIGQTKEYRTIEADTLGDVKQMALRYFGTRGDFEIISNATNKCLAQWDGYLSRWKDFPKNISQEPPPRRTDGMMLSKAIKRMQDGMYRDFSDEYIKDENPSQTRDEIFAGEWCWHASMVPTSFAIQLAKKVLSSEGDQFIPYEEQK